MHLSEMPRKSTREEKGTMLAFFIGLFIGTVVGVAAICLIVAGKGKDRVDVSAAPRFPVA